MLEFITGLVQQLVDTGGPVVMIMLVISLLTLALIVYKIWQFAQARVGSHAALQQAIAAWDAGEKAKAHTHLQRSKSYLRPVVELAMSDVQDASRLEAEAETRFAQLERGFKWLDSVAQLTPLLGLFGTVLGMIAAFRALQDAGAQVDPSLLAGGIWVALLTTAVGLAIAMPTSVVLSWLEARMDAERVFAMKALRTLLAPRQSGETAQKSAEIISTQAHA